MTVDNRTTMRPWVIKRYKELAKTDHELNVELVDQAWNDVHARLTREPQGKDLHPSDPRNPGTTGDLFKVFDSYGQEWVRDDTTEKWTLKGSDIQKNWVDVCMEQGPMKIYESTGRY